VSFVGYVQSRNGLVFASDQQNARVKLLEGDLAKLQLLRDDWGETERRYQQDIERLKLENVTMARTHEIDSGEL